MSRVHHAVMPHSLHATVMELSGNVHAARLAMTIMPQAHLSDALRPTQTAANQPFEQFWFERRPGWPSIKDIRATLSRVRPGLATDAQALKAAFTERISGRASERRGNGLKFVRYILLSDGLDLWFGSGAASYQVTAKNENWSDAEPPVPGCCAILSATR